MNVVQMVVLIALASFRPMGQDIVGPLRSRVLGAALVGRDLIVGRARCQQTTWLLTEGRRLVAISHRDARVVVREVRSFRADDAPWGLACVRAGTLWTLASPRTLARLDQNGRLQERIDVRPPRVALFSVGERLLFQPLPFVAGTPLFAASRPDLLMETATWSGPVARSADSRESVLTRNLVNCGIPNEESIPCWFPDEAQIMVSDGTARRSTKFPSLEAPGIDRTAPIWDVALLASGRLWVLTKSIRGTTERPAGGRLIQFEPTGIERSALDLHAGARLILAATETHCLLLNIHDDLIEVVPS